MNTSVGTTMPARDAAKTRLVFALEWLFKDDDQWRPVPSADGATITLSRYRAATLDTVVMSPDATYAVREDSNGQEVARVMGTAVLVVAAVCGWPVPFEPSSSGLSDCVPALSGLRM